MKRLWIGLLLVTAVLACCLAATPDQKPAEPPQIAVYFSPHGGCQDAIVREIDAAKEYVHVQAYSFTNAAIGKALLEAKKRGVAVQVVIDAGRIRESYSEATFFTNQGIPTFSDGKHAIAHNKVMVIDGKTVITGSFNFTKAAEESNAENLLILHLPDLAAKYEKNYQEHLAHSVKYEGKAATSAEAPQSAPAVSASAPASAPTVSTPAPTPAVAPVVAPKNDPPADDPIVYVTTSGKKYHTAGCRYLAKSQIPMKLSEAKAKGYTPCSVCNPPQ